MREELPVNADGTGGEVEDPEGGRGGRRRRLKMAFMRLHFEPLYRSEYGLTRAAWRRLSGIEKVKVIHGYRDRCNADVLRWYLEMGADEIGMALPYPLDHKFESLDPIPSEERGDC